MAPSKNKPLRIQWVRSAIGFPSRQERVVRGLGLRRLQQVVERDDTPEIRGMITTVGHLVKIVPPSPADPLAAVPEYIIVGGTTAKKKPVEPKAAPKKEAVAPKKAAPAPAAKKAEAKKPAAKPKAPVAKAAAKPASPAAKTKTAKTAKKPVATSKTTGKTTGKSKSKPADKSKKKK